MKPPFLFFALVVFIFGACEKTAEKSGANQAQEIQKLNEVLKKYEEPAQVFEIPTDKPTKIVGKLGTTLYVDPNDLIGENGQK